MIFSYLYKRSLSFSVHSTVLGKTRKIISTFKCLPECKKIQQVVRDPGKILSSVKKNIIEFCLIVHENPQDYFPIKSLPPWPAPRSTRGSVLSGEAGQDVPILLCFSLAECRHAVMHWPQPKEWCRGSLDAAVSCL